MISSKTKSALFAFVHTTNRENSFIGRSEVAEASKIVQFPQSVEHENRRRPARNGGANALLIIAMVCVGLVAGTCLALSGTGSWQDPQAIAKSKKTETGSRKQFSVTIRKPDGPPRVHTGLIDIHGQPVTVSCATCHATRTPNPETKSVSDLNDFHGSLQIAHGTVSCLSCHNSTDYDALKLADGTRIEFTEVMTLCAQCHGQQMRDYEHGAHGGFNGHWDLTLGPQVKNNCVDCHNPHVPKFPKMQPTFKPRDRFLDSATDREHK